MFDATSAVQVFLDPALRVYNETVYVNHSERTLGAGEPVHMFVGSQRMHLLRITH